MELNLPPDLAQEVARRASMSNLSTEEFAVRTLRDQVYRRPIEATAYIASPSKWQQKFDAFLAKQTSHNPEFVDSRESIYAGDT